MCTANITLEYLTRREQLMEDIDSIVDGQLEDVKATVLLLQSENKDRLDEIVDDIRDELTRKLCDAVCKNFHI